MIKLEQQRTFILAAVLAATIMALGIGQAVLQREAEAQGSSVTAPMYEVDPLWPKPLPQQLAARLDHRRLGRRAGLRVDHPSRRRRAA